jgi:hypothetical protein
VANILSVVETCRQQGRKVLEFLTACCEAALAKRPIPSLLPQTPDEPGLAITRPVRAPSEERRLWILTLPPVTDCGSCYIKAHGLSTNPEVLGQPNSWRTSVLRLG